MTPAELAARCPGLNWSALFAACGKPEPGDRLLVDCPAALAHAAATLGGLVGVGGGGGGGVLA